MVVQLLPLGGLCAEERSAAKAQVLALVEHIAVNEEVFLLRADLRRYSRDLPGAEEAQRAHSLAVDRLH